MRTLLALMILSLSLAAQQPGDPCATGELPCDPDRPWMRGTVEKYCHQTQADVDRMQQEAPGKVIVLCHCQHQCDPMDPHAGETDMRKWDQACEARCNPSNCNCKHACDS